MMNDDVNLSIATAELAHEALIRSWSRFTRWVDSDAGFQRWLVTMEDRVAENETLPEARISEAERWLAERPDDIPAEIHELVGRSRNLLLQRIAELENARNRAEESARQAEEARHQVEDIPSKNAPSAPVRGCLDCAANDRCRWLLVCLSAKGCGSR